MKCIDCGETVDPAMAATHQRPSSCVQHLRSRLDALEPPRQSEIREYATRLVTGPPNSVSTEGEPK